MEKIVYLYHKNINNPLFEELNNSLKQKIILVDLESESLQQVSEDKLIGLYILECENEDDFKNINLESLENAPVYLFIQDPDLIDYDEIFSLKIEDVILPSLTPKYVLAKISRRLKYSLSAKTILNQINIHSKLKIELTSKEEMIFDILWNNRNSPLVKEDIEKQVWKNLQVSKKCFEVHLCNLRKKIVTTPLEILSLNSGIYSISYGRTSFL